MKRWWLTAVLLWTAPFGWAAHYRIDPEHSAVTFKVRHLVGTVSGRFDRFTGSFDYDRDRPGVWKASATVDAGSVNTNNARRDAHLRSEDFLDVAQFPALTFVSKKAQTLSADRARVEGVLTIHGVSKTVALLVEVLGVGPDPFGGPEKAAFAATVRIDRHDFGLDWSPGIEAGGVLVGDEVDILLEIEGIRQ